MTESYRVTGAELTAAQLYAVLTLRMNVFVLEQRAPYPELDGRDLRPDTVHYWWQPAGQPPLAYLRVLAEPGGGARIGRVCTVPAARGQGLAARLMAAALAEIGDADVVLDAQVQAQGLYLRFGFTAAGEPFDDDGIPHITMRRPGLPAGHTG